MSTSRHARFKSVDEDSDPQALSPKKKAPTLGLRIMGCQEPEPLEIPHFHKIDTLIVRRKTIVDMWKKRFPLIDENGQPPFGLRHWMSLPNNAGLPQHVEDPDVIRFTSFTRGKIGERIIQCSPTFSNTTGKLLRSTYSALHDPHCAAYFKTPQKRKHLQEQQLVSPDGNVYCSLKEMREYNGYVLAVNTAAIDQYLLNMEEWERHEREQVKTIQNWMRKEENEKEYNKYYGTKNKGQGQDAGDEKLALSPYQQPVRSPEQRKKDLKETDMQEKIRVLEARLSQEEETMRKMEENLGKVKRVQNAQSNRNKSEMIRKREVLLTQVKQDIAAELRRIKAQADLNYTKQTQNLEWVKAKIVRSKQRKEREELMWLAMRENKIIQLKKREKLVERRRAYLKFASTKRIAARVRLQNLVSYFFHLWLEKTRERKKQRDALDVPHRSMFIGMPGRPDPAAQALTDLENLLEGVSAFSNLIETVGKIRRSLTGVTGSVDARLSSMNQNERGSQFDASLNNRLARLGLIKQ